MTEEAVAPPDLLSPFGGMARHFGRFVGALAGSDDPSLLLAAAMACRSIEEGHVCLDLGEAAGRLVSDVVPGAEGTTVLPGLAAWVSALRRSRVVGAPGDFMPLVLDGKARLYLYRYWEYERKLADALLARTATRVEGVDGALLSDGLGRLFPARPGEAGPDWQRLAALAAVLRPFCVISGGPGTGKTSTVVKVLVLLLEQAGGARLRIALCAPTGKAAARLKESLAAAKGALDTSPTVRDLIPGDVSTVHRLLGASYGSSRVRYDAGNPLPFDVVVVDEASMVDLPMMSKLAQAVPRGARLILLGDKDQLASVEAGDVLGDVCGGSAATRLSREFASAVFDMTGEAVPEGAIGGAPGLNDSVVVLRRSYRFGEDSGMGRVSRAVNEGNGEEALSILASAAFADVAWKSVPSAEALARSLSERIVRGYSDYLSAAVPEEAFESFGRFHVLCALRRGPFGAEGVNLLAERVLADAGLIRPAGYAYRGRPVMVTVNDYSLGLYNGDTGIVLPDPGAGGSLRAFFPAPEGGLRKIVPSRLPEHRTAYAMTVHKSQGSEFDRVLFLIPDRGSEILTRELVYTAVTRARKEVEVWGREEVFLSAVSGSVRRSSGLRDALWGDAGL